MEKMRRMYRCRNAARAVGMVMGTMVILMFIPTMRNILTLGLLPKMMKDVSTYQLVKMQIYSRSSRTAALSPCTLPARAYSEVQGHRDRLQQLLTAEPHAQVKGHAQDEAVFRRARAWINHSRRRRQRYSRFLPAMTPRFKAQLVLTWRVLHEALTMHNITHFLVDATLLGALRHGGIIPWDDEMDIGVHAEDLDKVQRVLSCIPGYTLHIQPCMQWKFFADDAKVVHRFSKSRILHTRKLDEAEKKGHVIEMFPYDDVVVRAPYVDIFLMTTDGAYIWSLTRFNLHTSVYPREHLYPLTQRVFEGHPVPVPRHSAAVVNRAFEDPNVCVSSGNDHMLGKEIVDIDDIQCSELAQIYNVNHV